MRLSLIHISVEIKAISREAGARTKMAVWSKDENVDPVGACIGPRGQRVAKIVEELLSLIHISWALILAGAACLGWALWKARQVQPAGQEAGK